MVIPAVQVIYSFEIGGVEKLAVAIGAHLDRARFRPVICALDGSGVLAEEATRHGIAHHVLWRKGVELGVLARLYRCFRQEKARIVHTHQFPQLLYSALPARIAGAKIVHTEHEYYLYRRDARARWLFRQLMRFCSALTVVGPDVARFYVEELGVPAARIHIVANGVDLDRFNVTDPEARRRLGVPAGGDVVFGIVGRLEPEKDHRTLLQAFRALIVQRPAAHLLIVGDGRLRGELESLTRAFGLERNVTFAGARADIPEVLAALDVFVLSSVNEGVPLSVVEAMAAGKPVIATDVGGLQMLVKPSLNGLLVPPADPAALAAAMGDLAAHPARRQEMGMRSRQMASESFSLATMVRRYQEIYASVLGERDVRN